MLFIIIIKIIMIIMNSTPERHNESDQDLTIGIHWVDGVGEFNDPNIHTPWCGPKMTKYNNKIRNMVRIHHP